MKQELSKYADEIVQDGLGSVFGLKKGDETGPRVLVAGHMDEVGFMVTQITKNGMLRFQPLGGWWSQVLLAQRVQVMTKNGPVIGVVGSIPPHLLSDAQRAKPMDIKNMLIDIGADSYEDAIEIGVKTRDNKSCQSARLRRWQTKRKLWRKLGTTVMDVALQSNY